ncbi:transient receptor potential channel pyrexia-like [Megalops cyprinoides]|uniref:transient receptor potential channel pyrexia-like n=1 Tax=Megalops cyprinoides TaxID=118141 RepID=UPI0018647472|nr:transient receptor potential channel pyrexia-like [Megalops cyprinoides]
MTDGVFSQADTQPMGSRVSMTSITSAVRAAAHWASYTWKSSKVKYQGLARDDDITDSLSKNYDLNKRLLDHFRALADSNQDTDEVDLQYLHNTIKDGADVNSADKYGQTALHEISRAWNADVMHFFLERGADVQRADSYGVTPLHVAAALDYEEMIQFLLERQADIGARTHKDLQTPLHFAAKNDAVGALRILLQHGADIAARDYKQRTPLQLAANLDRSEAARTLLELGADAGVRDSDGQLCITAMIGRMPPVAQLALNQFHVTDRMTRQQFYYLHLLEPEPPCKSLQKTSSRARNANEPTSPLEFIVRQGRLDLIMHPVVLKLIAVKWNLYGRAGAWILLLLNFFFIVSWTTVAISVSVTRAEEKPYVFPADWWRVLVVVLALGFTVMEICQEVAEMLRSRRKLLGWQSWCERRISDDLRCAHPMWPERLKNVFDWLVYVLLIAVFGVHVADIFIIESTLRTYSLRLFAVTVIFLWLRLMKHVRAFRVMGPFIVMLGKIVGDVLRFLFLYIEIYIPYACAFWIIFGGTAAVPSMETVPKLLYSLYRLTLVDEYEFDAMVAEDSIMAHLLCGTFLALSAILCVNLLIALLSDTFQRVYDNAFANAVMQQASVILQVEESMPRLRRFCDDQHIHRHCAPLAEFYDEDIETDPDQHAEMAKLTTQIKETLDEFLEISKQASPLDPRKPDDADRGAGHRRPSSPTSPLGQGDCLRTLQKLQRDQNQQTQDLSALRRDVRELQALLQQLIQSGPSSRQYHHHHCSQSGSEP